jgi:tetratricopeptide (TPR) repeat protein
MLRELEQVVRVQPGHAAAHLRLAQIHLQVFDHPEGGPCPIPVRQLRQSALAAAGKFTPGDDLRQWLQRAFGPRSAHLTAALYHARWAAALCPLQAEAYLCLAETGFLDAGRVPAVDDCVAQAIRVRPFDGAVLFEAGQEAMLACRMDDALGLWRRSFACGSSHQERLIGLLADMFPAGFFLEAFDMDWPAIKRLESRYRELKRTDQVLALLKPRIAAASRRAAQLEPAQAATVWLDAAEAHQQLGAAKPATDCLRRAVQCDRSNYDARRALGVQLFNNRQFAEAKEYLSWCLKRRRDESLRAMADQILDQEVRTAGRPQADPR